MIATLKMLLHGALIRLVDGLTNHVTDRVLDELDDTDPMPLTHRDAARINRMSKAFDSDPDSEPDTVRSPELTHNPRMHSDGIRQDDR